MAAETASWYDNFLNAIPGYSALKGTEKIAAQLGGFLHIITDGRMWRSLGWILLGILLMFLGLSLWLKLPSKLASAAETAV